MLGLHGMLEVLSYVVKNLLLLNVAESGMDCLMWKAVEQAVLSTMFI